MNTTPTNTMDVIDSRDVIARIEELEREIEIAVEDNEPDTVEDEYKELVILKALAEDAEGSPDWEYGKTLIRDSYFQDYAQELAEDIGAFPPEQVWPCCCIDWEQAVHELQQDYMLVEFDGIEYWIRA